jgi:UTP:GlnB (protein PII) uridylyltransferase
VVQNRTFTDAFVDSMPVAYRNLFDRRTMATHAAIVQRRGRAAAHVEPWKWLPDGVVAICVVADDATDLVSRICAAAFTHGADVVGAHSYSRVRDDGATEAVALLWIRLPPSAKRATASVRARAFVQMERTLDPLLRAHPGFPSTARLVRAVQVAGRATVVDFGRTDRRGTSLTVRAEDHSRLLPDIKRALLRERVRIRSSRLEVGDGRAVARFWLADEDGGPLSRERQIVLRIAVLEAIHRP